MNSILASIVKRVGGESIALTQSSITYNSLQAQPNIDDPTLTDWTTLPFVTIDNPDSRDLDQALFIESQPSGYRCRYALADAYHYVQPGTALFQEALERGSSYYLPGRSIPMLPVALSEDLVSLNATEIVRARIKSHAKLSYEGVQRWFDDTALADDPVIPTNAKQSLQLLKVLGLALIARADGRDVIQFDRRETEISLTDTGFDLHERDRYDTERYNEQISLLCNMQGAKLLQSMNRIHPDLQPIFRVHEAPLKKRLAALNNNLNTLIAERKLDERFKREPSQSLADYVSTLPDTPDTQRLVQAIERQILMTNQASEFRAEPGRHHALGAASYARFSSPMREMVGIFTQIIEAANSAKQRQKQIGKAIEFAVIDDYLKRDLESASPTPHEGTVMGFRSGKIYDLDDLAEQYGSEYNLYDIKAAANDLDKPAFVLGDAVKIGVREFDEAKRRFRLNLTPA